MAYPASSNLLFLSLLPFLPVFAASNINLSSSLSATGGDDSWISPSGEFAFGFCKINNTNTFLLAIWYAKIPKQTIVWHANTSSPVQTGSKVNLTPNGLALNDPSGQTIWKAQPNTAVSYGAMLDTGNFVLSGTNNSFYVWESFDYPTDTILPTQVLSLGGMLYSKLSEANYSKGRFELHFTNGGDLELVQIAWPSEIRYQHYYTSATANPDASQSGFQLVFSKSADINIVKRNGTTVPLSWVSITPNLNNYHRATLDSDGVFRQYTCPKTSIGDQSWLFVRYIPGNICAALTNEIGSGVCGFNSYCLAQGGTVDCQCPLGYSFFDPNDKFGGCRPNFPQGCGVDDGTRNPNELYDLVPMVDVNFPFGDYDRLGPYNQTQCEQSCLHDCLCAVAIFSGTNCWKKRLPLSNGRLGAALAIIKVRKGSVTPSGSSHYPISNSKKDNQILLWSLFGSSGFGNILLLILISPMVFSRHQKKSIKFVGDSSAHETNLRIFTYEELKVATDRFKEELGRGSFGIVYKGVLKFGSKNQVAVKKLDKLSQGGEREFKAEVSAIGKTHH
ncbi:G-type lectin S-receptor-like serine/threonine-protein kinase LECRK3 [Actinidia eriantha]|uniref:G-type lectin S-receptor-like serine/threonine-protein kinase LECRK3 n=1 Tax=Actinidia eriantha TaxID=165200 RepID=UPI00258540C2|nr:G-type lectin S-receptor-like serine/threonine-protein kinase LECRK3 [Actinidia eriantha]